jgi:hypothetical protein
MIDFELLRTEAARHPYPLLFATISGAHLYGFPSPDSDYDLRGVMYFRQETLWVCCPNGRLSSSQACVMGWKWIWSLTMS